MKQFLKFSLFICLGVIAGLLTDSVEVGVLVAINGAAWPFGDCDLQTPAYAATLAVTIADQLTFLIPATLTGALTINLTIVSTVRKGAILVCQLTSDGTARTTTFGTGFTAPALAGVISKTLNQSFIYNGTTFVPMAGGFQIN